MLGIEGYLPAPAAFIVIEPELKVRVLMLFNPKRWNLDLVRNLFNAPSAKILFGYPPV